MPVSRFYALGPLIRKDICVHWRNFFYHSTSLKEEDDDDDEEDLMQ
jgi:hypothetical protein